MFSLNPNPNPNLDQFKGQTGIQRKGLFLFYKEHYESHQPLFVPTPRTLVLHNLS
jgi:hypothetical protein